jgi:hypothetical protein
MISESMPYLAKKPWSWATQRGATRKFIAAWAMTTLGFAAAARTLVQLISDKHRQTKIARIFVMGPFRDEEFLRFYFERVFTTDKRNSQRVSGWA